MTAIKDCQTVIDRQLASGTNRDHPRTELLNVVEIPGEGVETHQHTELKVMDKLYMMSVVDKDLNISKDVPTVRVNDVFKNFPSTNGTPVILDNAQVCSKTKDIYQAVVSCQRWCASWSYWAGQAQKAQYYCIIPEDR
jgi:hypothetical protein